MNRPSHSETVSLGPPLQTVVDQIDGRRPVRVRGGDRRRGNRVFLEQLQRLARALPVADRLNFLKALLVELSPKQLSALMERLGH